MGIVVLQHRMILKLDFHLIASHQLTRGPCAIQVTPCILLFCTVEKNVFIPQASVECPLSTGLRASSHVCGGRRGTEVRKT